MLLHDRCDAALPARLSLECPSHTPTHRTNGMPNSRTPKNASCGARRTRARQSSASAQVARRTHLVRKTVGIHCARKVNVPLQTRGRARVGRHCPHGGRLQRERHVDEIAARYARQCAGVRSRTRRGRCRRCCRRRSISHRSGDRRVGLHLGVARRRLRRRLRLRLGVCVHRASRSRARRRLRAVGRTVYCVPVLLRTRSDACGARGGVHAGRARNRRAARWPGHWSCACRARCRRPRAGRRDSARARRHGRHCARGARSGGRRRTRGRRRCRTCGRRRGGASRRARRGRRRRGRARSGRRRGTACGRRRRCRARGRRRARRPRRRRRCRHAAAAARGGRSRGSAPCARRGRRRRHPPTAWRARVRASRAPPQR
jgi:hypothetical protein